MQVAESETGLRQVTDFSARCSQPHRAISIAGNCR